MKLQKASLLSLCVMLLLMSVADAFMVKQYLKRIQKMTRPHIFDFTQRQILQYMLEHNEEQRLLA